MNLGYNMNEIFILGTGESLLKLTQEEKNYINNSNSIAVNSFLMFYNLIDIIPKSWVYIDVDNKTKTILKHTYEFSDNLNVNWYLGQEHVEILNNMNIKPNSKITEINVKNYNALKWSKTLTDEFFWASVIGYAINLVCILYPNSTIKILGMDGIGDYFYTKDLDKYSKEIARFHSKMYLNPLPNENFHNVVKWMNSIIPKVKNNVKEHNCSVYVCDPDSIFVGANTSFYDDKLVYKPKEFFEYKAIIN